MKRTKRVLSPKQIEQLLSVLSKTSKTGTRNRTIIMTMSETGIKLKELLNLKNTNVNLENCYLHIEAIGGGNDRDIPISTKLEPYLIAWNNIRPKHSHFYFSNLKGKIKGRRLSKQYILAMVKRCAVKSGLGSWIHPFTLRYSFARNLIEKGNINTPELQYLLGLKHLSSTQVYTNIEIEPKDLHKKMRENKE